MELADKLKNHVYEISHNIGDRSVYKYEKLVETEQYITRQFQDLGYNAEFQEYTVFDKILKNIIVTKVGINKPQETVIIGAHYDTCYNPGADDNASAVAGLLELARFMYDKQTNCTIKFIAFVNEEPPFFRTGNMGSRVYTKSAKDRKENIRAAVIMEMLGYYSNKAKSQEYPLLMGIFYPNKGDFISVVGNFQSRWLVKRIVSSFKNKTQFPIESIVTSPALVPGIDFSDHWSFWEEGYSSVMITDTGFYRNPHYHTSSDTYETLDYDKMAEVVIGIEAVIEDLAE